MTTLSVLAGDIAGAQADALCTSTNPRLSLVMGTGASVRERGGIEILRACEAIVAAEAASSGRHGLPAGSVHATTAGTLPHNVILHCVASDAAHRSSPEIVAACTRNALAAADAAHCRSVAMPVFGSGHAHVRFARAVEAMAAELLASPQLASVVVVVNDVERAEEAQKILRHVTRQQVSLTNAIETSSAFATLWDDEA